jgi:putative transposase
MPRSARACAGGYAYHITNRGNARAEVFHKQEDLDAFLRILSEAGIRVPTRIIAYCLMPNHFHFVLWPRAEGDLSRWMHCEEGDTLRIYLLGLGLCGN